MFSIHSPLQHPQNNMFHWKKASGLQLTFSNQQMMGVPNRIQKDITLLIIHFLLLTCWCFGLVWANAWSILQLYCIYVAKLGLEREAQRYPVSWVQSQGIESRTLLCKRVLTKVTGWLRRALVRSGRVLFFLRDACKSCRGSFANPFRAEFSILARI